MNTKYTFLKESESWSYCIAESENSEAWVEVVNLKRDYRLRVPLPKVYTPEIAEAIADGARDAYTDGYVQGRMEVTRHQK